MRTTTEKYIFFNFLFLDLNFMKLKSSPFYLFFFLGGVFKIKPKVNNLNIKLNN